MEPAGKLAGKIECKDPVALSPDGTQFACVVPARLNAVDVWSIPTGQAKRLNVHPTPVFLDLVEFVAPGKLLTCNTGGGGKKLFSILNVATGQAEGEVTGPGLFEGGSAAFSPGGAFPAGAPPVGLDVFYLQARALVGAKALPRQPGAGPLFCRGLAFAPSGGELAGVFQVDTHSRILVWDVARGDVVADHAFPQNFQTALPHAAFYRGKKIDWLADGSGWLVYGQAIIDRASGASLTTLPTEDPMPAARRILDQDHL